MSRPDGDLRRVRRRLAVTCVALALGAPLAGCASSGLGGLKDGTAKNVAVQIGVTEWDSGERGKPVSVAGTTIDGSKLDTASLRGKVVVLNVWGSWCGPCTEEAPALVAAHDKLTAQGVEFVGIDTRDSTAAAAQFVSNHKMSWPSLADEDGSLLLAFRGKVNPSAVPATLVLDRQGRVAARVLGAVRTDTLTALASTVAAEQ